ncbi:TetR/AcrR family transcriptional regulator [Alloiococcus sp. CFN-8]|uniref:TetR/AcrR family transcriptional regulator n=1 Tax=Alloiococcus sp. CFN-8 TaxID=3416081 RepID=UPI003CFB4A04
MAQIYQKDAKDRILDAALNVVNKNTISGTRMHLIADEADMVQSNIHYYYKTKDELMLALQNYILEECYTFRKIHKKSSKDDLESQLDVYINQKKKLILDKSNYDFAEIDFWVQGKINEEIRLRFQHSYEEWRREIREILDKYCKDMNEATRRQLPYIVVSMLEGATIQYGISREGFDVEEYFASVKRMVLNEVNRAKD